MAAVVEIINGGNPPFLGGPGMGDPGFAAAGMGVPCAFTMHKYLACPAWLLVHVCMLCVRTSMAATSPSLGGPMAEPGCAAAGLTELNARHCCVCSAKLLVCRP